MVIPSLYDSSLNKNPNNDNLVCMLFTQYTPTLLKGNRPWRIEDKHRYLTNVFRTVDEYAPGFSKSVVHMEALFPDDLEREFGLTGGNIFHGAMSLNNLYFNRPSAQHHDYSTPYENLFMCGSGSHPGGGVMGSPGRLCAQRVLKQVGL